LLIFQRHLKYSLEEVYFNINNNDASNLETKENP